MAQQPAPARPSANVVFLQTAETSYRHLLETSSRTVTEYCARHGYGYESYFGVLRGYHPWQATYNRIPLLKRRLDSGYRGWVCYLDADAYIADLNFDLGGYLRGKEGFAFIAAPGGRPEWWDLNAGVFLINLGHPLGQEIVRQWTQRFDAIEEGRLREMSDWSETHDDQTMLHEILCHLPGARDHTVIDGGEARVLNYLDGKFIRQIIRAAGGMTSRINYLQSEVDAILGSEPRPTATALDDQTAADFIRALYRVLLLREPDESGFAHGVSKMKGGVTFEDNLASCLRSAEFGLKYREFLEKYVDASHRPTADAPNGQTPEDFIRALYRVLLLREPDESGFAHGVSLMKRGVTFEDNLASLLRSAEFAAKHRQVLEKYVDAQYRRGR